ncbi:MAG: alpha/beta hydrolase fold domain-containing protein [Clostridiales bacterium]|nr:alpha/beta hydrolase fold domain-containing protein [Clostridiales bacterium]
MTLRKVGKIILIVLLVLVVAVVLLCLTHLSTTKIVWQNLTSPTLEMDTSDWTGGTSYENVQYSDVSDSDYLHLYVPDSEEPMPLLILVHGGGFVANDLESRQAQFMYRYFRQQGYACATVNYRLAAEDGFPAALEDVKAAVRYLRANAETYGYDPDCFVIWGESAGGYLATMAAVTNDEEFTGVSFIGEDELAQPVSAQVSCLMDFYGIIDFPFADSDFESQGIPTVVVSLANSWASSSLSGTGYDSVEEYWLNAALADCTEAELAQYTARYYIEENWETVQNLNVLIWHSPADITVAETQSIRLYQAFLTGTYVADGTLSDDVAERDGVTYQSFAGYKHADDRYYSDESLANIVQYLDALFG